MPANLTPLHGPKPPQILRSRRSRATAVALGAFPLALVLTGSAHAAVPHRPAGAVKLPARSIKHVSGVTCGKVGGVWTPGTTLKGRWFVTDARQAKNYQAAARHARGATKRADLAQAKVYKQRALKHQPLCTPRATANPGPSAPAPGPSASAPTPLRFNLSGAIGLALSGGSASTSSATSAASPSVALLAATPAATSAAPQVAGAGTGALDKVYASGQLASAITSGSAPISHVLVGPGGRVYVVFSMPVNLDNTSQFAFGGTGCVLAQVDPSSGVPTCVDSSLSMVNWNTGPYNGGSAPIQFDSSGAVYYSGGTNTGQTVLRRSDGSNAPRNLVTDNVWVNSFAVAPNGTVVVSGSTKSTSASWTRAISPSGAVKPLSGAGAATFTAAFPDGNLYVGIYTNGTQSVMRYVTASGNWDTTPWIADSTSAANNAHDVWCPGQPFCSATWASLTWQYSAPNGHEYVVTGMATGTQLAEYDRPVHLLNSEVTSIDVAAGVGNQIALAGTTADNRNVLTLVNPDGSGSEQELIGADDPIAFYHLNYVASSNTILFDGLRFADNQYVIGAYNLSTKQYSVTASPSGKLADLQGF
jgi:hypothetical protein